MRPRPAQAEIRVTKGGSDVLPGSPSVGNRMLVDASVADAAVKAGHAVLIKHIPARAAGRRVVRGRETRGGLETKHRG